MEMTLTSLSDSEILSLIQKGNPLDRKRALVDLYQQHAGPLQGYLLRLTRCKQTAEDLAQETFLRALDKIDRFAEKSSLKTWLYTIATNLYRDQRRRDATVMNHKIEVKSSMTSESNSANSPEQQTERTGDLKNLHHALDKLPDDLRGPVVLVRLEGLKYIDAAKVLGISINALRMRIHRGHLELVRALRGS